MKTGSGYRCLLVYIVALASTYAWNAHARSGKVDPERAVIHPPAALLANLGALMRADRDCDRVGLSARHVFLLSGNRLLLLLEVANYFGCRSNAILPATVDSSGEWKWGEPLAGEIQAAAATADGSVWVASEWIIEGGYPALYRSADGVTWIDFDLPSRPPVPVDGAAADWITELCPRGDRLEIQEDTTDRGPEHPRTWIRPSSTQADLAAEWIPTSPAAGPCDCVACIGGHSKCMWMETGGEYVIRCRDRTVEFPKRIPKPFIGRNGRHR